MNDNLKLLYFFCTNSFKSSVDFRFPESLNSERTTFQVLGSHLWQVMTKMNSIALDTAFHWNKSHALPAKSL
jgi:hypothetical protein